MTWFRKKKRGLIYLEATGGGLVNDGTKYKGNYEVVIEQETDDKYKIRYVDNLFQRSEVTPKWVDKGDISLIAD